MLGLKVFYLKTQFNSDALFRMEKESLATSLFDNCFGKWSSVPTILLIGYKNLGVRFVFRFPLTKFLSRLVKCVSEHTL